MKSFNKFTKLKPGSIKLGGMLKKWAGINTGAWLLEYAVRKHTNIYGKFWNRNKTTDGNYDDNNQTVILCDYTAYFADGMIRYSQLFENSELADEAEKWIGLLLKSQDADGYIGAFEPQARWKHPLEIFSQALVLETLLYKYEATGEDKFLNAIEKAAQLQIKAWNESQDHGIFYGHGAVVIRMFGKLYDLTGKKDYLVFANLVLSICGRIDEFINSGDALMNVHDVVGTEYIGLPAMLYEYCGDENLEKAGRRAWDMMVNNHLSVTGSPHGAEIMLRTGPRENCEHCGTVEWIITSDAMARMCGEVKYADEAEVALYNAYPAAKSPDGMTVTYLHTPNQLVASEWSNPLYYEKPDRWDSRGYYSSAHEPLCCNSNGPRALPYFLESMIVRYCDGLAIMYYGACKVCEEISAGIHVDIEMESGYPFDDDITIKVTPETSLEFGLKLRIPSWCDGAAISINGEIFSGSVNPGTYTEICRKWGKGDLVELHLDTPVRVLLWPKSEFGIRAPGIVAKRGPLTFALPVKEDWQKIIPPAQAPTQDRDSVIAYRVLPSDDAIWNYALCIDSQKPANSFIPVKLPVEEGCRPWEKTPLGLKVMAKKVLNWKIEGEPSHPLTPGLPYNPMKLSEEETEIVLVPFGFTHLRMTYIPCIME